MTIVSVSSAFLDILKVLKDSSDNNLISYYHKKSLINSLIARINIFVTDNSTIINKFQLLIKVN